MRTKTTITRRTKKQNKLIERSKKGITAANVMEFLCSIRMDNVEIANKLTCIWNVYD